ncbi:unknown [Bacteroides eggerthii CAG:109]|nr:unknown [Bacteroides eggerthii CAG:109]
MSYEVNLLPPIKLTYCSRDVNFLFIEHFAVNLT